MFLYSAVSSPCDCSNRLTLYPLADLFIPTPSRLLWEAFTARRQFVPISIYVYSQVVIYTGE